tara:strand:+ start:67 stop:921 length:855 start_codon:yes stop_codon:yes gene_type:complete
MFFCKNFKNLILLIIIFITYGCTNTRIIVEGTKKVLETKKIDRNEEKENIIKGHYKVGNPYIVDGIEYKPKLLSEYNKNGIASWYGPNFHNKMTANGEIFDQDSISAAHKVLPLPSIVKVINTSNNLSLYIRINDRGPFVNDRIIDLSKEAAIKLNFYKEGTTEVNVILIDTGPHLLEEKYLDHSFLSSYAKLIDTNKKDSQNSESSIFLQVGAFSNKKNAKALLNYLKGKINDNLFVKDFSRDNNNILYKVFAGPFLREDIANKISSKILDLGYSTIFVKNLE